jgi:hypothetical protein
MSNPVSRLNKVSRAAGKVSQAGMPRIAIGKTLDFALWGIDGSAIIKA